MEVKKKLHELLLLLLGSSFSEGTYVALEPAACRHRSIHRHASSSSSSSVVVKSSVTDVSPPPPPTRHLSCSNTAHIKFDSLEICADTITIAVILSLLLLAMGALYVYLKRKSLITSFVQGFSGTATRIRSGGAFRRTTGRATVVTATNELHRRWRPTPSESNDHDEEEQEQERRPQSAAIRVPASAVVEPKDEEEKSAGAVVLALPEMLEQPPPPPPQRFVQIGRMQVAVA